MNKIKEFFAKKGGVAKAAKYYLAQPSTLKGIVLILGIAGYNFDPTMIDQILTGVVAAIGAIEVARDEKK